MPVVCRKANWNSTLIPSRDIAAQCPAGQRSGRTGSPHPRKRQGAASCGKSQIMPLSDQPLTSASLRCPLLGRACLHAREGGRINSEPRLRNGYRKGVPVKVNVTVNSGGVLVGPAICRWKTTLAAGRRKG